MGNPNAKIVFHGRLNAMQKGKVHLNTWTVINFYSTNKRIKCLFLSEKESKRFLNWSC